MPRARPPGSVAAGDRAVFLGLGPRGKHCDVLGVRGPYANVRLECGRGMLCLAADLHPIPRRPPPMW